MHKEIVAGSVIVDAPFGGGWRFWLDQPLWLCHVTSLETTSLPCPSAPSSLIYTVCLWFVIFLFAGTATLQCPFVRWVGLRGHDLIAVISISSKWSPPILQCLAQLRTKHWTPYKLPSTLLAHVRPYSLAWPWPSCPLHLGQVSAQYPTSHSSTPEHQCSVLSAIPPPWLPTCGSGCPCAQCPPHPNILLFCLGFLQMRDLPVAWAAPAWSFPQPQLAIQTFLF